MSFHFVDSQAASKPGARTAIRRHVMKGKNLGRTIHGRGRKHALAQESGFFGDVSQLQKRGSHTPHEHDGIHDGIVIGYDGNPLLFPEIIPVDPMYSASNPFAGSEFAYFAFPVQFTSSMRYMVYQFHSAICDAIYPYSFCRSTDEIGSPWFRFMISDQAFLHCLLAMAATYLSLFRKPDCETLEATSHFSQALRLVNCQLSQPTPPHDSTIAVIVSLACHSKLIRDTPKSDMHLDGLQRILDLRAGGLSELRVSNRALMHKICRIDLDVALTLGTRTRYGGAGLTAAAAGPVAARILAYPLNQMCETLRQMTRELLALCRRPGRAKMTALQYQDVLISLTQRLVDFAPLGGERPQDLLDDVWQLGLLAFLSMVNYSTSYIREINCGLLLGLLRDRVESRALSARGLDYAPLRLWIIILYALSLPDEDAESRPTAMIREVAQELKVRTWDDVKARLRPFPWIAVVQDAPGKRLWESVSS
ncbi:hypothetical protein FZEAL_9460 [Fusarium zealandicum]|uniref:Uncharacterized protein n=1 Tax=Fusarium zealandicum TaxID=1053134 RepID=A0A8H4UAR3_9HYPO|nr:hypothetical protein FZEAL_9460 [Fusarium zealandicum]